MRWIYVLGAIVAVAIVIRLSRAAANRLAARAILHFRARIDRFKLMRKPYVTAALLADDAVAQAVRAHAIEHRLPKKRVWRRVEQYIDEIVPFFNVIAYYQIGYRLSRIVLQLFYKVTIEHAGQGAAAPRASRAVPRDAIVIYLMNHRSNADYVLVGYALSGRVAISYAVGEWARAFPLEYLFKSFGSYFIRRKFREPLYHTVLERYVQLITRHGVTQGIFPEGGLSRDGRLQPAKIGLLDYVLGVARDPSFRSRMYIIPVAVNYDRVLEDRSLLRELAAREGRARPSRMTQMREVVSYVGWNLGRLVTRRWKRYGRAAVVIGEPIPLAPWFDRHDAGGTALFDLPRHERLARVQSLCDDVMSVIGTLVPVTPVPLACAAIQSLDADFIPHDRLLARMGELRDALLELNARVLRSDRDIEETFDRAWRMLRMRRILARTGDGYAVLPRQRALVSYYANSIAHLLGPYAAGVQARDTLPALSVVGRG